MTDETPVPFDPGWFTEAEYEALLEKLAQPDGRAVIEAFYALAVVKVTGCRRAGASESEIRELCIGHAYDFTGGRRFSDDERRRLILVTRGLVNAILRGGGVHA